MEDRVMSPTLITDLLAVLDEISGGVHAGFRPAHAKGLMCIGTFSPSPKAAGLTRAPHANRPSTPVTVRYGEEFLQFLRAAAAAGAGKPEAMGAFLAAHPNARRFVEAPKPIPTSFAREAFFAGTAFKFTNSSGASRH